MFSLAGSRPRSLHTIFACGLIAALSHQPAAAQSTLVRLGEISTGAVTTAVTATLDDAHPVAAMVTPFNELKATAWIVTPGGTFLATPELTDGSATDVAVAGLGPNLMVTAARRLDGSLGLTSWRFNGLSLQVLSHAAAGPISDVAVTAVGPNRVVTATTGSTGILKLIVWKVDNNGVFTRKGDFTASAASAFSLTAAPEKRVVVATRDASGNLKVELYDISVTDTLLQRGMRLGPAILDTNIVATAYDRVVTASRLASGDLSVATWDLTSGGGVLAGTSAGAGAVTDIALTQLGSTRVATAVKQGDGTLKVITWQVVDQVKRLDTDSGGAFSSISATTLGWDRIILAVKLPNSTLKMIDWAEFSVGMIHRTSGPASIVPSAPLRFPATIPPIEPDIAGVDPMVAVGKQYVIASQDHWLRFMDKSGTFLPSKAGEPTVVSSGMLFQQLWIGTNPDTTVNRQNINLHLRFPLTDRTDMSCYPATNNPMTPCMDEVYDTRVYYDQYLGRFVIVAAVRHSLGINDVTPDGAPYAPIVRRYVAIGISRTEDPRDGFQQYMFTEPNYSDWPRMGVADGVLVIAHNAAKSTAELKPMAYIFSTADLAAGVAEPRNFKIYPYQTDGGGLVPVNHFGDTGGFVHMIKRLEEGIQTFSLHDVATLWDNPPLFLNSFLAPLDQRLRGMGEGVVFRNGILHFAGMTSISDRIPNVAAPQWKVRVLKIPMFTSSSAAFPSVNPADGFLDFDLPALASSDAPSDLVSCEVPALAVNNAGHILISYGRTPVFTAQPLEQEVRSTLLYNDFRGLQVSKLLRAGEIVLKGKQVGELVDLPIGHNKNYSGQADYIDLSFAVVDPSDDNAFWFTNEFASTTTGAYKQVIGKVIP